jgi:hypothetical protein
VFFRENCLFLYAAYREEELKLRVDILRELTVNEAKYVSLLGAVVDCVENMRKWIRNEMERERKGKARAEDEPVLEADIKGFFGEIAIIYNTHCMLLRRINEYKSKKWKV